MSPSRVLIIDNYDSFTYNLVQALGALGADVIVRRNDSLRLTDVEKLAPQRILLSPGPRRPEETGISSDVVQAFAGKLPILGVCLGHQCIAHTFGARVVRAREIVHGKTSSIRHNNEGVCRGLPSPFEAMRYHSLVVDEKTLPNDFLPTAHSEDDELMAFRHRSWPLEGVQFHPESYRTEVGTALLDNFLKA